jgi:hypothetical protein
MPDQPALATPANNTTTNNSSNNNNNKVSLMIKLFENYEANKNEVNLKINVHNNNKEETDPTARPLASNSTSHASDRGSSSSMFLLRRSGSERRVVDTLKNVYAQRENDGKLKSSSSSATVTANSAAVHQPTTGNLKIKITPKYDRAQNQSDSRLVLRTPAETTPGVRTFVIRTVGRRDQQQQQQQAARKLPIRSSSVQADFDKKPTTATTATLPPPANAGGETRPFELLRTPRPPRPTIQQSAGRSQPLKAAESSSNPSRGVMNIVVRPQSADTNDRGG